MEQRVGITSVRLHNLRQIISHNGYARAYTFIYTSTRDLEISEKIYNNSQLARRLE